MDIARKVDGAGVVAAFRKNLLTESAQFIDSLDRSVLGRFAADRELAIWSDAMLRVEALFQDEEVTRAVSNIVSNELFKFISAYPEDVAEMATSEVMMWWVNTYSSETQRYNFAVAEANWDQWDMAQKLRIVAGSPVEFHEYFAIGIWDKSKVQKFINAGIDPELARAVA